MRPRLLIVDDHAGFRRSARQLLELGGFDVVGEATTGDEVLAAVASLDPDLVLLDIALPDTDGFAIARQLAGRAAPPVVVLVSSRPRSDYGVRVDAAPVRGFLAKEDLTARRLIELGGWP